MNKIWVTSDLHLNHDRNFIWGSRGFSNVDEMNRVIIQNWNEVVEPNDIVYVLGDIWLGDAEKGEALFSRLNGDIYVAIGNHDTDNRIDILMHNFKIVDIQMEYKLKYHNYTFILNHYPTIVNNKESSQKIYCLCGHVHTQDPFKDWEYGCYHVEMDAHNCCPVALDNIVTELDKKKNS